MKAKKKLYEVAFIGGLGPMTLAEENAISEYLKSKKQSDKVANPEKIKKASKRKLSAAKKVAKP
jgi:hypothetical protein